MCALAFHMITPSTPRVGAIAAVSLVAITGCTRRASAYRPKLFSRPSSRASLRRQPRPRAPGEPLRQRRRIPDSPPPSSAATRVLRTGNSYSGVKYVWGGNTPRGGFDCSGFTKYVFAQHGVTLPRTSREQARAGASVAADFRSLRPGDLMFFAEPGEAISHVAIYAGDASHSPRIELVGRRGLHGSQFRRRVVRDVFRGGKARVVKRGEGSTARRI